MQPDIHLAPSTKSTESTASQKAQDAVSSAVKAAADTIKASNDKVQETVTTTVKAGADTINASKQLAVVASNATVKAGADTVNATNNIVKEAVTTAEETVKAGAHHVKASKDVVQEKVVTTVKAGAETVTEGKSRIEAWVSSRAMMHDVILATPPSVAVLVLIGDEDVVTPMGAMLRYRARVTWCKQERELLVFRMVDSLDVPSDVPSRQVEKLHQELREAFASRKPPEGPFLWAVHESRVCEEIQAHEMYILRQGSDKGTKPFWWKALRAMMIITPSLDGDVLLLYRAQFGSEVAFQYACSYLHVQHLWWLCVICLVMTIMDVQPASSSEREPDWYKWMVGMILVWLWLAWSTFQNWRGLGRLEPCAVGERTVLAKRFRPEEAMATARRRLKAIFLVLPLSAIYLFIYIGVFWLITSLILAVINNWGKCIERMARDDPEICRDPSYEHGGAGTVVEISCDVFLVIILEILIPLGEFFGEWLADVQNFKYQCDRDFFVTMVMAALGSFERIGFVGTLAMRFAPQWENPHDMAAEATGWTGDIDDYVDPVEDCSDLMLKKTSLTCIRRKLGVNKRRYMFEKLMKGPFIVAPFVAIIIKVILPIIVHIVIYGGRKYVAQRSFAGPCRMFWRLAALIFAYDGGHAGGLGFVVNGGPFEDLEILESDQTGGEALDQVDDGDRAEADHQYVEYILGQTVRKNYEPWAELFDLKMSRLWIAFFTPIMPVGVLFTTFAQMLKINFDMAKLLWARARPLPRSYTMAHRSHMAFNYAVLVGTFGWYIGLQLMTYNNDLYTWGKFGGNVCFLSFIIWEVVTFAVASYYWE